MPGRPRGGELYTGTPFRFPLRNEFPGRKGKIMRLAHDRRIVRLYPGWNEDDWRSLRIFTERLKSAGVHVPRYDLIRAPRPGGVTKSCTYVVLESIAGERVDEIVVPSGLDWLLPIPKLFYKTFYEALDDLCFRLFCHYEDILEHGGLVFSVMDQSQFIYGNVRSDKRPAVYFVDLDPTYNRVPAMKDRNLDINPNESKADFEKPINILFEMKLLQPEAPMSRSVERAKAYFARCNAFFRDFYSARTPWWARGPNFARYQEMKQMLLSSSIG
jgi:hypothetical protein